MHKIILVLGVIILIASFMFFIGAKEKAVEEAAPTKAGQVELVWWWWGEQDEPGLEKWVKETVEKYEAENPNVKIKTVLQPTDELIPAFQAAAQSRSGPDIQFFWAGTVTMEPVFNGYLAPISDYWSPEEIEMLAFPEELTWNGKVWAVSFYTTICPMVYNKEIFEKAGLNPENPPKTWDEYLVACEKIKKAGYVPFAIGASGGFGFSWLQIFAGMHLDSPADILKVWVGQDKFTDLRYSDWFYKIEELVEKGYINEDAHTLNLWTANEQYFGGGKAATALLPSGTARLINEEILIDKVGIMKPPIFGDGKLAGMNNIWRKNLGITEWSPHKEIAADFLKFTISEDRSRAMYDICKVYSGSKYFDPSIVTDEMGKAFYKELNESFSALTDGYDPMFITYESIQPAGQNILAGEWSAEEAAEFVEKQAQQWRETNPDFVKAYTEWLKSYE